MRGCASTADSTKPASRSTRRCLDTVGCGIRSRRSISPTDCCDETRRPNIARRFGSAMISNTDSTLLIYSTEHILVKAYTGRSQATLSVGVRGCTVRCVFGGCNSELWAYRPLHSECDETEARLCGNLRWKLA